jgi:hypothetical protein
MLFFVKMLFFRQKEPVMKPFRLSVLFPFLSFVSLALGLFFTGMFHYGCAGKTPTPGEVTNAVITCTNTVCATSPMAAECSQLEAAVMGCVTSGGNLAVCLAGIPALVSVGYADVVCIVAALATPAPTGKYAAAATPKVQVAAAEWLKAQRVTVRSGP